MTKKINNIVFYIIAALGVIMTLIYIFNISSHLLTSESVITDVILHQQILTKQLFLNNWVYGSNFAFSSINIFSALLSFFIRDNLILRYTSILCMAVLFFVIIYKYGRKFLDKKETLILILIYLTGVSYSVLDYFYAYNTYLTIIVNSLILLYLLYKSFEKQNNSKFYYLCALILTFFFGLGNIKYLVGITVPFVLTELILNKRRNLKKLGLIFLITIITFSSFQALCLKYRVNYTEETNILGRSSKFSIVESFENLIDITISFFGYDNRNNSLSAVAGNQYFIDNTKNYSILSLNGITDFIKCIISILFLVITPILLYKNYKKNPAKINFLLVFNTISWVMMLIYCLFFHNIYYFNANLKYFLFNFIISTMLGVYFINNYFQKQKLYFILCNFLIVFYLLSNIYSTISILTDGNYKYQNSKLRLVEILKANNLKYGYSSYYNSLLVYYLSDYEITVSNVKYGKLIKPHNYNTNPKWYNRDGKVFFILDEVAIDNYKRYKKLYGKPDKIIREDGFEILIYNKNPLLT